jgi:hypothetical protein
MPTETISAGLRKGLLRQARRKARAAGFDCIFPAGRMATLDQCVTVDRCARELLVALYFNVPSGTTLAVVRHLA